MNKFIMMVGLPVSGKSTYAQHIAETENAIIHSSDSLREELFEDVNENNRNDELFKELHNRIKADLINGKNVIYDACNINYKRRKAFLDELKKINCEKICCVMATPYTECLKQNQLRDRKVPEHVIKRMYLHFYIPQFYEGWDDIRFRCNYNPQEYNNEELFKRLDLISQDNPHHNLTIGEHCRQTALKIDREKVDYNLFISGLYHDIGKEFTKQFKNYKGKETNIAHYYQHHLVSAYECMFYLHDLLPCMSDWYLEILGLITWHMEPFFVKTEKAKNKFINLVGHEFYDKLMVLHEADIRAK